MQNNVLEFRKEVFFPIQPLVGMEVNISKQLSEFEVTKVSVDLGECAEVHVFAENNSMLLDEFEDAKNILEANGWEEG